MLKPQEWDSVLDNIQSGTTIVCLGAEMFAPADKGLDQQIMERLGGLENVHMYADGLFHFRGSGDMTAFTKIKQFYNSEFPDHQALLEKLAALPIPIYINANPDLQLRKTFQRQELRFRYDFHHPNKPARELEEPSAQEPLIYNLLGDVEHRESMVLTHEDLFGFLESVMDGKSISRLLKERINSAYNFIFIGLPFGKWYMKVLLHFLQKDANRKALKLAANSAFDSDVQAFVVDQFQITCVPTHITDFVDELHRRCAAAGLLRSAETQPRVTLHQRWTQLVQADELNDLLDEMIDWFAKNQPQDADAQSLLLQINGRLAALERMNNKGTIAQDDAMLQRNQIRDAVIKFLNETARFPDL